MTAELILIFIAFIVAGWIQGVLGFGFVIVSTLILINHMDLKVLVFLNLSMSLLTSLLAMLSARNLRSIHKRTLIKLVISASAGLAAGLAILSYVNTTALKQITLAVILAASVVSLTKNKVIFSLPCMSWITGFLSGVLTPSTGINGPPVVLHLNAVFDDKQQTRNTMLSYLLLIMAFGVASLSIQSDFSAETWRMLGKVTIPASIGYMLGLLSFRRLSNLVFQRTVTLFLIGSSILSLIYLAA